MKGLREYKFLLLSGLALVVFAFLVFGIVSREDAEAKEYPYLENLFAEGVVNEINIEISEEDWADLVENPLEETYYAVDVTINGETLSNVALRTKGNNTLTSVASSDSDRYSFKIDFDYFNDGENYYGLKKLNLNNNYGDASYMREYISYRIMGEMGIPVPATSYTHITINGEEWGLYLAVEPIDEVFLKRTFGDSTGDLYKPDGTGADLVYRGDDMSEYPGLVLKTNEETYFTEAYMSQIVSETAEMITPYVEKDATAFFTYDEFLEASSADATDPNSLVYFAVSMAESIENQLAGGEPTFNTSSFVAAAAGGGGKRPGEDFGGMQDTEQTAGDTVDDQTQRVPEQMGEMAGQPPEMTEGTEQTADTAQSDTAEANDQTRKSPEQMGDMPQRGEQGQRGGGPMGAMSRVTWQDAAPVLIVCGGIFLLGFGYLLYFRRRRRLSMPKQEEKTDTTE